jgi:hypothetical protein
VSFEPEDFVSEEFELWEQTFDLVDDTGVEWSQFCSKCEHSNQFNADHEPRASPALLIFAVRVHVQPRRWCIA